MFSNVLAELAALWADQDTAEQQWQDAVAQTLRSAETRQQLADEIAKTMSQRADIDGVPMVVLSFLYRSWSLVMADAKLSDQSNPIDPGDYGSVVADLIWSVKPTLTLKEPARFLALIPPLMTKLRAGLRSLGQEERETEAFVDEMMLLHQPVLKLITRLRSRPGASVHASLEAIELPVAAMPTPEQRTPQAAELPWLAPKEQGAVGFDEGNPGANQSLTTPAALGDDSAEQASSSDRSEAADADDIDPGPLLAKLRPGSKVDLYAKGNWLRAKLTWTNAKRTMFMFTSQGKEPHSMTARTCERLIRKRLLRPIGSQAVVAKALDVLQGKGG